MNTKREALFNPTSCLSKADMEEPVFVLRANDPLAPMVVRIWASLSQRLQAHGPSKGFDALAAAVEMETWYALMYGEPNHDWKK